ncbi:MAG: glycosyl transferase group 1 [Conexibacter sp.]|nr:glycosyl transferase group 1 [Conexibacter sp.]
MKILLASDHYPPFIGGAQRQTEQLAKRLHARGHEVIVATVWQDDQPAVDDDEGVTVHRLRQLRSIPAIQGPSRRRHQPPFPDPVTVRELRRLLAGFQPDIVHAAGWYTLSCAAAMRSTAVPLLVSARDYGFSCANATLIRDGEVCSGPSPLKCVGCAGKHYGKPRGWIAAAGVLSSMPLLRGRMDAMHSVSHYVEEIMRRDFVDGSVDETHFHVLPSFRVEDDEPTDRSILNQLPQEPFILFVGALRRVKGVETLLAAYRQLEGAPPMVLLGTLEADTPIDIPPGVTTIDGMPHWAVLASWERSLFGVMPSLWPEPFGSVVHEAMSRGKAVIGTRPGGHADMIEDGTSGFLVPAGDVDELRRAMQRLIDDPELRERFGADARVRAEAFAVDRVIPRFEELYRAVIAAKAARR